MFYGRPVPERVTYVEIAWSVNKAEALVTWMVDNDPNRYVMEFEGTDEGVVAALAAMRMS
jgi:hypothetical protein